MSQRPFVGGYVCFLFLGLVGGAVLAGSAWAVKGAAGDRIPERFERYSLIQVTEVSGDRGKGVPAGGRLNRAVESARQRALERAERYLDRKLRDAGLDYEIRRAKPDGAVRILDRRALGTDDQGRSRWRIDTEVEFSVHPVTEAGKKAPQAAIDQAELLTVRLWTDKKQYRPGEPVTVFFEGNRDFYAKVVRITAGGAIEQILPNNYRQLSFFRKGVRYRTPGEGDRFTLNAPPGSRERLLIFACPYAMSHINMKTTAGGVYQYRGRRSSFERAVRSGLALREDDVAEFFTAAWDFEWSGP